MATNNNNATNNQKNNFVNFEILSGISKVGTKKESIYLLSIFEGKTEKEKKSLRKKLRNTRDNVIIAFNNATTEQKAEIKNKWLQYSKGVYKDINIIFESNTATDTATLCTKFLTDLAKIK